MLRDCLLAFLLVSTVGCNPAVESPQKSTLVDKDEKDDKKSEANKPRFSESSIEGHWAVSSSSSSKAMGDIETGWYDEEFLFQKGTFFWRTKTNDQGAICGWITYGTYEFDGEKVKLKVAEHAPTEKLCSFDRFENSTATISLELKGRDLKSNRDSMSFTYSETSLNPLNIEKASYSPKQHYNRSLKLYSGL